MSDEGDRGTVDRLLDEAESLLSETDPDELAESDELRTLAEEAATFVADRETIDLLDAVGVDVPEDAGPADVPETYAEADAATIARLRRLQKVARLADGDEETTVEAVAEAFGVGPDQEADVEATAADEADVEETDQGEPTDEAERDSLVELVASAIGGGTGGEDESDEAADGPGTETGEDEGIAETVASKAEEAADAVRGDESDGETGGPDELGDDRQGGGGTDERLSTTYSTIPPPNRPDMRGVARFSTIRGKQSQRRSARESDENRNDEVAESDETEGNGEVDENTDDERA